jgi:RNA polymerase sigma-70 factor (ECF subfamily)
MNKYQIQEDDKKLLALIALGDKLAFSQLMERYLHSVILFVMRYFPQRSDAEDIAQETFIRLWCKAPKWHDKGLSVKAWLFRVAYNYSIDQLRKKKLEYKSDCDENMVDENAFIEKLMDVEFDLAVQRVALSILPERQRTAIMLCAIKGFSNCEAAAIMDTSVDALESLLARGRRKLKKLYSQAIEQQQNIKRVEVNGIN